MWRLSEWLYFRALLHLCKKMVQQSVSGSLDSTSLPHRTRKSYGDHSYARSKAPSPVAADGPQGGAKQSTPVKIRTGNVAQELEAKFKSAQAKATKVGVENLTKEDIDGLSSAQLKDLRGY